ncbi:sugar transferase [Jatrophihabitans fulvus]
MAVPATSGPTSALTEPDARPSAPVAPPAPLPFELSSGPHTPRRDLYPLVLAGLDLLVGLGAVQLAFLFNGTATGRADLVFGVLLPIAWLVATVGNGGYERRFVGAGNDEFARIFRAFLYVTVATVFGTYLTGVNLTRGVVVPALALTLAMVAVGRYAARKVLHRRRTRGNSLTPVIAVGSADAIADFAMLLRRERYAGLEVVGACPVGPVAQRSAAQLDDLGVGNFGPVDDIADVVRAFDAPTVAVLSGAVGAGHLRRIAWSLEGTRANLAVSPGLAELGGRRMHVQPAAGLPLLHIDEPRFTGFGRVVKGAFDRAVAALALTLLSPLLMGIALVIRTTSRGPAFFRQTRVGRNGREFTMWKFRTMVVDAEARLADLVGADDGNGVLFKMKQDPRVTRVGRLLRRVSLDELPQLINVLTGSMSLVGPRPPLPSEVERYHNDARRRLLVKPGMTGLWQISGRSNLSWEESIRLDLRYVEYWSLSLDLVVLWKTMRAVVRAEGAF